MALDTTPSTLPNDAERQPDHDGGRIPLWVAAVGAALLAVGFRLGQYAGRHASADDLAATRARRADAAVIPRRSWKDFLLRVYENIGKHRVVAMAASVTFYSILALFPAIAALVSLYGLFADPATIASHLDALSGVLPGGAVEVIGDELKRVSAQRNDTLGFAFAVGLGTALWSANAGMKALFDALNLVHDAPERRGFIKLNAVSLAFTAGAIGFVLLALGAVVVLPIALDYVGIATGADQAIRWLRWPALLLVVMVGLSLLYRYGPSQAQPRRRWITSGSASAAVLWLLASVLFSWYAADFGSYNKTYGSLGAVIGFMVWIWISTIVILLGAEIDAELERRAGGQAMPAPAKPEQGAATAGGPA
jgi:membrane protein